MLEFMGGSDPEPGRTVVGSINSVGKVVVYNDVAAGAQSRWRVCCGMAQFSLPRQLLQIDIIGNVWRLTIAHFRDFP